MDREALLATLPTNAEFNGMPPHQRKSTTENFVEAVLGAIEADGREPDDWETNDLAAAIGFINCRWYNAALAVAERALTPEDERAPLTPIVAPGSQPMMHLRNGLAFVRGMAAPAV